MKKIFEQINLGKLKINNRLIRSATMEFGMTENGCITEKYISLFEKLSKGGIGLIITGAMAVNNDSQVKKDMVNIYDKSFIDEFSKITKIVHDNNSKIVVQLAHGGLISMASESNRRIGPSPILKGCEMDIQDIKNTIEDFSNAAYRCMQADADGIEIHAAHGFLISQFLSPIFNKRQDDKKYIDAIEISSGIISEKNYSPARPVPGKEYEGYNQKAASYIADSINTPIICVGGYRTFSNMEQSLNDTNIAAFSLCRPLICEPDLPQKWFNDNLYKPKCISCNSCFLSPILKCSLSK